MYKHYIYYGYNCIKINVISILVFCLNHGALESVQLLLNGTVVCGLYGSVISLPA